MVFANTEQHIANERAGQSGGISEEQCHAASGLRSGVVSIELQSDDNEQLEGAGLLMPDEAVALGQQTDPTGGSAVRLNYSDITGPFYGGVAANKGKLSWPSTLCLSYFAAQPLATPRTIQWRVTGTDQFGNRLEETQEMTLENALTLHQTNSATPNDVESAFVARLWTSNVFASVDRVELAKPDTTGAFDSIRIGTCYKWDRADQHVVIYNDGTGGDFTITLSATIDGVVETDTTAAIAFNASAPTVQAELAGLSLGAVTIDDVEVTKAVLLLPTPATWANCWVIKLRDPVLGRDNVSVDDTGLTGNTGTAVVSGEQFVNRDGCGIGIPVETIPAGPPGVADNLYPDVLCANVIVPKQVTPSFARDIIGTTTGTNTVTLGDPHGLAPGTEAILVINNQTGILTGIDDLVAVGTAVADRGFTLNVAINTTGNTGGTATLVGAVDSEQQPTSDSEVAMSDAPGTRATPTGPGFRVGVSEPGQIVGAHKFQIFLDGGINAKLALRDGRRLRLNHQNLLTDGPKHTVQFWARSTKGTGRDASDVDNYPLPY